MLLERTSIGAKLLVCAGLVVFFLICERSMKNEALLDFYVYRTGAQLAFEGISPYETQVLRARVADRFPPENENSFANQCGFFLPPQAIVVFMPFAKAEWSTAEGMWFFFLTAMALLSGILAYCYGRDKQHQGIGWPFIVLIVLLNPITMPSLVVGQTTLLFLACFAMGQFAFENDCPRLGTFLWSIPFIKPHLALPFLVLAWFLGGWGRVAGIVILVAIWNLLGGMVATGSVDGSIRLFRLYVEYIGSGHKAVVFNLVAENYQITSWNRILAALGGPAIDLKIWMTLTGLGVWALLLAARMRLRGPLGEQPLDPAYLLAVTTVGALFSVQVLAYEMILLALLAPLILQHLDAHRRKDAFALIVVLLFLMIPINLTDQVAAGFGWDEDSRQRTIFRSHRCFGMAALAILLLVRGPGKRQLEQAQPKGEAGVPSIVE